MPEPETDTCVFVRVALRGGSAYVQRLSDLHQAIDGELSGLEIGEEVTITLKLVTMPQAEYDNLPDFPGH